MARKPRTNPLLTNLAKWLLLNSKAGAIVALVLAATTAAGFGGWGITALQLHQAQAQVVAVAKDAGRSQGQLDQLAHDSEQRAADAKAALQAATKIAGTKIAQAKALQAAQPSHPNDLCQSANELMTQEIAKDHQP